MATGEIRVGDLPTMSKEEFTANDFIFIIDDGVYAKKMGRTDFLDIVKILAQGEKGDTGAVGAKGDKGDKGDRGEKGDKGDTGATGLTGATGTTGAKGNNGWSPVLSVVNDGERRVQRVASWTGGTGTAPTSGQYIGSGGLVSDIAAATDIRGQQGLVGAKGDTGATGANGADGAIVTAATYNDNNQLIITNSDQSVITSDSPKNLLGWSSYKDGQYTDASKLSIISSSTVVIPNNGAVVVDANLPTSVTSLYNSTNQKILLTNPNSLYGVRIRLKLINSGAVEDFINITLDKATTDIPFSSDVILRADSNPQIIDISTHIYGDEVIASNGLTARLKAGSQAIQLYDVEFILSKLT